MRIGVLRTFGLALLLAGLACTSSVSGEEPKAPAPESLDWLRGRAEKGNPAAQSILGFNYAHGQGVPQDYVEAVRWYRKAADQGFPAAQHNLGVMYRDGQGVPQDHAEAFRWFRKAADQGNTVAQYNVGAMYASGQVVTQDYVGALMWMDLAASRGSGDYQKIYADEREKLAAGMPPQQVAEAQRRAREWQPAFERNPDVQNRK